MKQAVKRYMNKKKQGKNKSKMQEFNCFYMTPSKAFDKMWQQAD